MYSTRKALLGLGLTAMVVGGCAPAHRTPKEAPGLKLQGLEAAVPPDEAMDLRIWDRSTLVYANGAIAAGPTGVRYQIRDGLQRQEEAVFEPLLFIGQAITAPFVYVLQPRTVVYEGADTPPTHSAVPVVEAEVWP